MTQEEPPGIRKRLSQDPRFRDWAFTFGLMRRSKLTVFSAAVVVGSYVLALFAPYISPYAPNAQNLFLTFAGPSLAHPLGTDELGRDILSRIIWGSQVSMEIGIIIVALSTAIGLPLGAIAGYYGKWVDEVIMRITDIVISFPGIVLAVPIRIYPW